MKRTPVDTTSTLQQQMRTATEFMDRFQSFLLITHRSPDGDAIGSTLGLAHYLKQLGKEVVLVDEDPVPSRLRFLPGSEWFHTYEDLQGQVETLRFDAVITLDAGDLQQLGTAHSLLPSDCSLLNIDHHATNSFYGTENYVDVSAASATQVVYNLLKQNNVEIPQAIAQCLYTGLATDTGGFRHSNTNSAVHLMAADLIQRGVDPFETADRVLVSRKASQLKMLQQVLSGLEIDPSGEIAWAVVTQEMMEKFLAADEELEDLVEFPRSIDTVEVAILFKERSDGSVKVSLRSKYRADVTEIAVQFGGGGHRRAAGCTIREQLSQAVPLVLNAVREHLGIKVV